MLELSKTSKTPAFRLDDVTGDLREHTENVTDDVMQDVRIHEPSFFYNQKESYMSKIFLKICIFLLKLLICMLN